MNITLLFTQLLNTTAGYLGNNYGLAIIVVTLIIRLLLLPIILPSVKSHRRMIELQPQIDELKRKYKDKQVFAKKQMELFQKEGVNPLSGCLPQLVQLGLFFAFYHVLINSLNGNNQLDASTSFLWLDLTQSDKTFVLPVLAGLSQFILGLMLLPATTIDDKAKKAAKTISAKDDKDASDFSGMAKSMQTQMVFVMPVITLFIAVSFPSGLALYWVVSTVFSLVQQYYVSGWGGLKVYAAKLNIIKK